MSAYVSGCAYLSMVPLYIYAWLSDHPRALDVGFWQCIRPSQCGSDAIVVLRQSSRSYIKVYTDVSACDRQQP